MGVETRELRTLAIIPAYNEEESIVSTIEGLRAKDPTVDYVIINDGSGDDTLQICKDKGYNVVDLSVNCGLATGFQTGMKYAKLKGYDRALQFDADGQHSAECIEPMVVAMEKSDADIVIGSRFVTEKKENSSRMIGSRLISCMIRLTTGKKINDPTSGMRLYNKDMIDRFSREKDFGPEPDTVAYLIRQGAKVAEVQVTMKERLAGESYLSFTKSISYMLRVCISILFVQWFR